jgi:hypothetical protein
MQDFKWYDAVVIALMSNVTLYLCNLLFDASNIIDTIVVVVGFVFAARFWLNFERFRLLVQSLENKD